MTVDIFIEATKIALKRKFREDDTVDDISSINEPSSSATLHGVVTSLSPMKKGKSCKYFDGKKEQIFALLDLVHQLDVNFFSIRRKMIPLLFHTVQFSVHGKMMTWK